MGEWWAGRDDSWAHWSESAEVPWHWHCQQAQQGCQLPGPLSSTGPCLPSADLPRTVGLAGAMDQNPGGTMKPSDICLLTSRRMQPWSRALPPQSCGAWCGIVLLQCFVWAATGQRWRETPQGQVTPQQSQTGTSSPLKVGAAGQQGVCPRPCSASCPQTCLYVCPRPRLVPEARGLRAFLEDCCCAPGREGWAGPCCAQLAAAQLGWLWRNKKGCLCCRERSPWQA